MVRGGLVSVAACPGPAYRVPLPLTEVRAPDGLTAPGHDAAFPKSLAGLLASFLGRPAVYHPHPGTTIAHGKNWEGEADGY